jgi:class 3 adenylate cyclase
MSKLPDGTVTFLFTDIEGSTGLWERHRKEMEAALARHDALLRQAVDEHGGYVFKGEGDAVFAAFQKGEDAVAAALAGQQTLLKEDWGEVGAIRVRMAIHTGVAQLRDGDYFGPPLNRVSRILTHAKGGEVLLSRAVYELSVDALPPRTSLVYVGEFDLAGMDRPEHVYQLRHPDLDEAVPEAVEYFLEVLAEGDRHASDVAVSGYVKIGRGSPDFRPDVMIPQESASASRRHAELDLQGRRPILKDRSAFGTIVNGRRLEHDQIELSSGDEIIFGLPHNGWRVRFRVKSPTTTEIDPLELLSISDNPRQIRIGQLVIEENLGRAAFNLLRFLSEHKGSWYTTDGLIDLLWTDPDKMPVATDQALARNKKRINDLLKPYLRGQDAVISAPFRGYRMKPMLDAGEKRTD